MSEFWQMVKDDHRRDPEALPWVLEMTAATLILTTLLATIWFEKVNLGTLVVGVMAAACLVARYAAKRWEP